MNTQKSLKSILIEILTIAGYPNNKEKFIRNFEALNLLEAILNVYNELPKESKEFIKAHGDDIVAIQQHIPQDRYKDELIIVTRNALTGLLKEIAPLLNAHQKERINGTLNNL